MITAGSNAWQAAHGRSLKLDGRGRIMAIVNATPDSFSDGGRHLDPRAAIDGALAMVEQGADILDLGAESTRPGARTVPADEELARLLPVIEGLKDCGVPLSIDTRKPAVMRGVLEAGADMINDVAGFATYLERYRSGLAIEAAAVAAL